MTRADFWSHVYVMPNGCWEWRTGTPRVRTSAAYGYVFRDGHRSTVGAHRVTFDLFSGQVPAGMELDHLCRDQACCNPSHVEPVPHKVNILRGESPQAVNARKAECPYGHAYSEHVYVKRNGHRECNVCRLERAAKRVYPSRAKTACKSGHDLAVHGRLNKRGRRDCTACPKFAARALVKLALEVAQ